MDAQNVYSEVSQQNGSEEELLDTEEPDGVTLH